MWALLEGKPDPTRVRVDKSKYDSGEFILDDLKQILKEEFSELRDVGKSDIVFFNSDDRTIPLKSGMILTEDTTTDENPLVVRYPLSDSIIVVNFRYYLSKDECTIPHSSGSLTLLRQIAREKFKRLQNTELDDIYFEYIQGKSKEEVYGQFHFNKLLTNIRPNGEDKRIIDYFKVQVKGKKAYGEWKLKEVSELYDNAFTTVRSIDKFNIDNLPKLSPSLEENELGSFVEQLKKKCYAFQAISANEATAREFISIFLTYAVNHVRKNNDPTTQLAVEVELDGRFGYGNLDYAVYIQSIYVLVTEAKMTEMEKGIAQNLVQIHSAVEGIQKLGKRKHEQTGFDNSPTVYGIVTTGVLWRFICCSGPLGSQTIEISEEFNCGLDVRFDKKEDTQGVKEMLSYIVRVLQAQAEAVGRNAKRRKNN